MAKGTVKWFSIQKGYGFITPESGSAPDVFVHYTDMLGEGFKSLKEGESVEFELTHSETGDKAVKVVRAITAPLFTNSGETEV